MERVIDATTIRADGSRKERWEEEGWNARWRTKRKAEAYLGVDP